ncbi:MAG: hypothetical protein B7Z52_05600, partial [Burkholderiales bacterium 12-64-5]
MYGRLAATARGRTSVLRFCGILILSLTSAISLIAAEPVVFNRDVRPILSDKCFACHGPDSAKREAGLRLDRRELA